jgi:ubiquinone biosynthesis monooxygenase Coq7
MMMSRRFYSLKPSISNRLDRMIRVDHAGELAAYEIYKGQLLVLKRTRPELVPLIQEMQDQEKHHLETFKHLVAHHRVRPTIMTPIWKIAGVALGGMTALLGKEGAMACTEAVETVIGGHYNDQVRELLTELTDEGLDMENEEVKHLVETIRQFRDDELEHLDTAVEHDAQSAPAHPLLSAVIARGCKGAIWISERI